MMTMTTSHHTSLGRLRRVSKRLLGECWALPTLPWHGGDEGRPWQASVSAASYQPASLKIYFHPEGNQSVVILTYSLMCSLAIVTDILLVMLPAVTNGIFAVKRGGF